MRMRGFKPEIFTDVKTGTLPSDCLKLFIGLLSVSDDYGVSELCINSYRALIFPYSTETPETLIKPYLHDLIIARGLARIFEYQGKEYLFINNFRKHQNVNRYQDPLLPGWIRGDTPESYFARLNSESANEPFTEYSVSAHCRSRREENRSNINKYQDINIDSSEIIIEIPLIDGAEHPITQKQIDVWSKDYPSLNIKQTLVSIKNWNIANPRRRKTKRGILKHIIDWFEREQKQGAQIVELKGVKKYARYEKPIESIAEKLARQQLNEFTG